MDSQEVKVLEAKRTIAKAKECAHNGELKKSLQLFKEAYNLVPSEKLTKRISKLEEFIANISDDSEEEEDDEDMVDIGKQFYLHKSIANKLYDYQKLGVLWFWKLFRKNQGGILGDDMGLGKTIQVIAFMAGLFDAELIKHVVIVAPLSILVNWEKEFGKWAGGIRIKPCHGNKKQRMKNLHKIQNTEGILVTTYGMILSSVDSFCVDENGDPFAWDYIILDEGHKIKNPTKTSKCVRTVPAKFHYILSGTPIQNNLNEMWSLFDFTQQGQLLGTKKTFDTEFQKPIVRAREKDASEYQQQVGNKIAETLRKLIAPFFLRRTKAEVFNNNKKMKISDSSNDGENGEPPVGGSRIPELKTRKDDLIIWCLVTTRSPLVDLNLLKKISDHPRLQSTLSKLLTSSEEEETRRACGIEVNETETEEYEERPETTVVADEAADAPPVEKLIEDSGKMVFLANLMTQLQRNKHRTIIFSQSRKMLDIIQKVLLKDDHKLLRIDGRINNPLDREKIVQLFQTDSSYTVMLMTTQVGSVGLTLTGADRLIIFDPSWNPGTDAQAVDRVYRVGQTKNVVIYRLITCGSIEEKIYRKQIFKNAIMKQATGSSNNPYRYFTNQELRELFVLDDPRSSTTQIQLQELHKHHTNTEDEHFEQHLQYLNNLECIFGVTHHDQMFSQEAKNSKNEEYDEAIEKQVNLAEQRVTEEFNNIDFSPSVRKSKSSSSASSFSEQDTIYNPPELRKREIASKEVIHIDVSMSNLRIDEEDNGSDSGKERHETHLSISEGEQKSQTSYHSNSEPDDLQTTACLDEVENSHQTSMDDERVSSVNSTSQVRGDVDSVDTSSSFHKQESNIESPNQSINPILQTQDNTDSIGTNSPFHKQESNIESPDQSVNSIPQVQDITDSSIDKQESNFVSLDQTNDSVLTNEMDRSDHHQDIEQHKDGMAFAYNDIVGIEQPPQNSNQLSYEVVDTACSPIYSATDQQLQGHESNVEENPSSNPGKEFSAQSSYEVTDIACSPMKSANASLQITRNTPQKSNLCHTSSTDTSQNLSGSFIVDDMKCSDDSGMMMSPATARFLPKAVQDLGRGYRTPPVSPVVSLLMKEGARLLRDASTPVDKPSKLNFNSTSSFSKVNSPSKDKRHTDSGKNNSSNSRPGRDVSSSINQSPKPNSLQEQGSLSSGDITEKDQEDLSGSGEKGSEVPDGDKPGEKENVSGGLENGSFAISLHISEESSASLYETRDVSCSPVKQPSLLSGDEGADDDVKSFQTGTAHGEQSVEYETDKTEDSVFDKSEKVVKTSHVVSDTDTQSQASTSLYASDGSLSEAVEDSLGGGGGGGVVNSMNYTNIGASPSEHKRSKAATFFDVSSSDGSHHQQTAGVSQYADTQPMDVSHYSDSSPTVSEKSKSKVSIVLEDSTQEKTVDTSEMNSTAESDVFDLDRLKRGTKEEGEGEGCEDCIVIGDSLECESRGMEDEFEVKQETSTTNHAEDVVDHCDGDDGDIEDMTKSFNDADVSNIQGGIKEDVLLTEEKRRSKLVRLKCLLLKHMYNTDLETNILIRIVELMDELKIGGM